MAFFKYESNLLALSYLASRFMQLAVCDHLFFDFIHIYLADFEDGWI